MSGRRTTPSLLRRFESPREFYQKILGAVHRRAFGGQFYDCIGAGKERWECTTDDGGGFGQVRCDTLRQAVVYFTNQPWTTRAQALTLELIPEPRKVKGRKLPWPQSERYLMTRDATGWSVHMSGAPL